MSNALKLFLIACCGAMLTTGCYTRFGSALDRRHDHERISSTDRDSITNRVDTVRIREREICYWSRDLLGYPVLRCDRSRYHRDWFLYHNSPWWYRNDAYWYDYDRCPRFYYYDPSCGCCRYYTDRHCVTCPPGSGNGGSGGVSPEPTVRPSIPDRGSRTSGVTRVPEPSQPLQKSTGSQTPAVPQSDPAPSPPVQNKPEVGASQPDTGASTEQENTQHTPPPPPQRRSPRSR